MWSFSRAEKPSEDINCRLFFMNKKGLKGVKSGLSCNAIKVYKDKYEGCGKLNYIYQNKSYGRPRSRVYPYKSDAFLNIHQP
jgi:hypothetical protein